MEMELVSKDLDDLIVKKAKYTQEKYSLLRLNEKKEELEKELEEINILLNLK